MMVLRFCGTSMTQCVLEIQDGRQITGSVISLAGFTDTHVVPKTMVFMSMYETSESPAILADATSCLKSKMAAN